jgi:hypothetical protein
MATVDKDFKVKNGLVVVNGGTFGGPVTVATPTLDGHAATKEYVDDSLAGFRVPAGSTFPDPAEEGQLWFDEISEHLYLYINSAWNSLALLDDTLDLPQHIHDTAIDGTGLVVSIFKDAGYYNEPGDYVDAGYYNSNVFEATWDGGIAVDNFN